MSREVWYYIKDDMLVVHEENDGWNYMRKGPQPFDVVLCSVEEAKTRFPKQLKKAVNYDEKNHPRQPAQNPL